MSRRGETHHRARYSDVAVERIIELRRAGHTYSQITEIMRVIPFWTVVDIARRKTRQPLLTLERAWCRKIV